MDFVDARLVLGEPLEAADVIAAANVAARLGFETSAMDLPIRRDAAGGGAAIVIGSAGVRRAKLSPVDVGLTALKAGEGMVRVTSADGNPAVVIAGADAAGTLAAAELFAARLPHAGDVRGPTLDKVARDVREFLTSRGVAVTEVEIPAAYVRSGGTGNVRLVAAFCINKAKIFLAWRHV